MIHGQVGQHLTVEIDTCFLKLTHEFRVRHIVLPYTGIDTRNPERAIVALLGFAITISISETFFDSIFSYCPHILFTAEESFGRLEHAFASFSRGYIVY